MNSTAQVCWFSFRVGFLMGHLLGDGEPINDPINMSMLENGKREYENISKFHTRCKVQ